jgi:hypothetical protein
MISIIVIFLPVLALVWMIDRDRERSFRSKMDREADDVFGENIKVCRLSHRPFKPCMNGCEHSEPHVCFGNTCLEHKCGTECVSASVYGYSRRSVDTSKVRRLYD